MAYCLDIKNLSVQRDARNILSNVSMQMEEGKIHAIIGPNGAGKSTFFYGLMGHPDYQVCADKVLYHATALLDLSLEERAQSGIFLCFQTPIEISGLSVITFLKEAHYATCAARGIEKLEAAPFLKHVRHLAEEVGLDAAFLKRSLNVGFSGGEKKRFEMLQMLLLRPKLILLDEVDSGLDMDALKMMVRHIQALKAQGASFLIISHYQHFLESVNPDEIHVFQRGTLKMSSHEMSLVKEVAEKGYDTL